MPIILGKNEQLAEKLKADGVDVISQEEAAHQDIRELHVGILNLMPDAALRATERQFIKLLASCNKIIQIHIHLFTLSEIDRSSEIAGYIASTYENFHVLKGEGLDALIITGAPPMQDKVSDEIYNNSLTEVIEWGMVRTTSVWISCLSAQFMAKIFYNVEREKMDEKLWGVFSHKIINPLHPLVKNLNTRFNCIHSRFYNIDKTNLINRGFESLVECENKNQFLLAVSQDGIRIVLCQGHPEYDTISLFKEYKRDVGAYLQGLQSEYPCFPVNYFTRETEALLFEARQLLLKGNNQSLAVLEDIIKSQTIYNTWTDTSKALFSNWLGLVYQLTGYERTDPFRQGIDPNKPLESMR